jgi:DNA-directed RNA polymerase specialized sigma24 family protein
LDGQEELTRRFERQRGQLRAVAYRMLGSAAKADDAVQEAWLRLSRADVSGVTDLEALLRTVVAAAAAAGEPGRPVITALIDSRRRARTLVG